MDILTVIYYATLFCIPIVLRIVFKKRNTSTYTKKTWYSIIKEYVARSHIKNYQKRCRRNISIWSERLLESPRLFLNPEKDNDTVVICGLDEIGNSIKITLILRQETYAEVSIRLCLKDGRIYQLPNEPRVLICDTDPNKWKAGGLTLTVLEPLASYRITFNGLMRNAARDDIEDDRIGSVEHVKFNFIWRTASDPIFYPQDYNWKLIAENLARERWRNSKWIDLLGDHQSYEHYGSMHGYLNGAAFPKGEHLYFKSWRKRYWGKADCFTLNRSLSVYVAADDGTLINVGIKSVRNGCSHFKYGTVRFSDTSVSSIQNTDLNLYYIGQNNVIPNAFTFHVKAANRSLKCVLHVQKSRQTVTYNDESIGWRNVIVEAECFVNSKAGRALLTFRYPHAGDYKSLPQQIVKDEDFKCLEAPGVVDFKAPACKVLQYSGGKGRSLAYLSAIDSSEFTVPEGFVITTDSFRKQLHLKPHLQTSIDELQDVSRGKIAGDLETYCKATVQLIQSETIDPSISDLILRQLATIKGNLTGADKYATLKWAVRSSGVCEDSDDLSAAGQNSTFLGVSSNDELLRAVAACWASLFTYQSVQYRRQYGFKVDSDIAVVVQRMIDSDCAGVLFTCHPTTYDPSRMVVTANYGLGESVVSGRVEPDTIVVTRSWRGEVEIESKQLGGKGNVIKMKTNETRNAMDIHDTIEFIENERSDEICLTDEQILQVARVGVALERTFDGARDIEWAFYQNELYLLQSRPITTIHTWTKYELLHEFDSPILTDDELNLRSNVGEVLPFPITPLTLSVLLTGLEQSCPKYTGIGKASKYYMKFFNIFQYIVHISGFNILYRALDKEIVLANKLMDISFSGHIMINDRIHKTTMERFGPISAFKKLRMLLLHAIIAYNSKELVKTAESRCDTLVANVQNYLQNYKRPSDLFATFDEIFTRAFDVYLPHHQTSMGISVSEVISLSIVCQGSDELTPDHYTDIANLLSSCENVVSANIPMQLEKISKRLVDLKLNEEFSKIPPNEGIEWLQKNCPEVRKMFDDFMKVNGCRGLIELELIEPSWEMNPQIVIEMLQQNCRNVNESQKSKSPSLNEILDNLKNPVTGMRRKFLKFFIQIARKGVGYRENTKRSLVRGFNVVRKYFIKLGELMALEGILPNGDLIFHLTVDEIRQLLQKPNPTLLHKCTMRQREYRTNWRKIRLPEMSFGIPQAIDEGLDRQLDLSEKNFKINGTPASSGDVIGRACVIQSLDEINQLQAGDVLITHATDIGWSPYFPILSGVVTELGGLISHGAVVAREYGLPCLIGATDACNYFKTGDKVLLSGTSGKLELIARE